MDLMPTNKRILISKIEDQENVKEKNNILIPEGIIAKQQERYSIWEIKKISLDCDYKFYEIINMKSHLIVEHNMVEEIKIKNNIFYMIHENYVVAFIHDL